MTRNRYQMSYLVRQSNYIDQRTRLLYNNGDFVMISDLVKYNGKLGRVVNYDRQTVNIILKDGTSVSNVPVYNVQKADIVDELIDGESWIKK